MANYRKRGDHWQVRVCINGSQKSHTAATKSDAMVWAAAMEATLRTDSASKFDLAQRYTLAALLQEYMQSVTIRKKGARQETGRLRYVAAQEWAKRPLLSLSPQDFTDFIAQLETVGGARGKPMKPDSIRLYVAELSAAYNWARIEKQFYFLINPLSLISKPAPSPHRKRRLTLDEEARLMAGWMQAPTPYYSLLFVFAIATTMRMGELFALRWEQVNVVEERVLQLPDDKAGGGREVPLSLEAVEILSRIPQLPGDSRVFPIKRAAFESYWKDLRRRLGIQDLRLHDLRREGASRWASRLKNSHLLKKVTGHRTLQMVNRYINVDTQEVLHAMDEALADDPYVQHLERVHYTPRPSLVSYLDSAASQPTALPPAGPVEAHFRPASNVIPLAPRRAASSGTQPLSQVKRS